MTATKRGKQEVSGEGKEEKKIAHRIKVSEKWKVKLVVNAKRLSGYEKKTEFETIVAENYIIISHFSCFCCCCRCREQGVRKSKRRQWNRNE